MIRLTFFCDGGALRPCWVEETIELTAPTDATIATLTPCYLRWVDGRLLCLEHQRQALKEQEASPP